MTIRWRLAAVLAAILLLAAGAPTLAGDAAAGEDGFRITEGDSFTLDLHFLVQFQGVRDKDRYRVHGGYWDWYRDEFGDGPYPLTTPPRNSFNLRRARLVFTGKAFQPWLSFRVEVESNSRDNDDPDLMDAWVRLGSDHGVSATIGQFKAPFDIFRMTRSWKQLFHERPWAADWMAPGRDTGVALAWRSESGRYLARAAFQNGSGRNRHDSDDGVMTTLRFEIQNEGGFDYDLSGVSRPESVQYTLGVAWLRNPLGYLADADTGSTCLYGISRKCTYDTRDQDALEIFGAVRTRGFQATVSWQRWTYEDARRVDVAGRLADLDVSVLEVEAGLFVGEKVELAAMYSNVIDDDYDLSTPLVSGNVLVAEEWTKYEGHQFGLGINWYFDAHNMKLQFGWQNNRRTERTFARQVSPDVEVPDYGRIKWEVPTVYAMLTFYL